MWVVGGGGGMLPKLATSCSFAFAFASTTLSINTIHSEVYRGGGKGITLKIFCIHSLFNVHKSSITKITC